MDVTATNGVEQCRMAWNSVEWCRIVWSRMDFVEISMIWSRVKTREQKFSWIDLHAIVSNDDHYLTQCCMFRPSLLLLWVRFNTIRSFNFMWQRKHIGGIALFKTYQEQTHPFGTFVQETTRWHDLSWSPDPRLWPVFWLCSCIPAPSFLHLVLLCAVSVESLCLPKVFHLLGCKFVFGEQVSACFASSFWNSHLLTGFSTFQTTSTVPECHMATTIAIKSTWFFGMFQHFHVLWSVLKNVAVVNCPCSLRWSAFTVETL